MTVMGVGLGFWALCVYLGFGYALLYAAINHGVKTEVSYLACAGVVAVWPWWVVVWIIDKVRVWWWTR